MLLKPIFFNFVAINTITITMINKKREDRGGALVIPEMRLILD